MLIFGKQKCIPLFIICKVCLTANVKVALELIDAFVKHCTCSSQINIVKWEYVYVMHLLLESAQLNFSSDSRDMSEILPPNNLNFL